MLLCLAGCQYSRPLSVRSEYLDTKYLAAKQIDTPDPRCSCFTGQQLVIRWNLPPSCVPAEIVLQVRYGNREMQEFRRSTCERWGTWMFRLMDKDFWKYQGILSYSVQIYHEGTLIDQWNHHLWAEVITIDSTSLDQSGK